MGKKTRFDWVRDAEEQWTPRKKRVSLSEKAVDPNRAAELTKQLLELSKPEWALLELDDTVIEALEALGKIGSKSRGARKRQIGLIAKLLVPHDLDALEASMGGRRTEREEQIEQLVRWRTRLVEDGDAALAEFIELHPDADRQRLRQLATQLRKVVGTPRQTTTQRALLDALKDATGLT